ncbi:MAG: hypothetical protein Q8P90_02355 [bacterium]|nr:hypothetical protein [bacterium]
MTAQEAQKRINRIQKIYLNFEQSIEELQRERKILIRNIMERTDAGNTSEQIEKILEGLEQN